MKLKDQAEIIFCISAGDIEKNRIRADLGLSYDNEVLRLIDKVLKTFESFSRYFHFEVSSKVINRYHTF